MKLPITITAELFVFNPMALRDATGHDRFCYKMRETHCSRYAPLSESHSGNHLELMGGNYG